MKNQCNLNPDYIFESSWEVCNKIGGIYTVLATRAKSLKKIYDDKIIFIGPDLSRFKNNSEFIEIKTSLNEWKEYAIKKENLKIRVGRWNIPGNPITILIDFSPFIQEKDLIYFQMWEKYRIDSTVAYGDYDDSCLFAYAVGKVIESLYYFLQLENKKVIAYLNEWMLSFTILYLRIQLPSIATIFITHATSVGRSICENKKPLYSQLSYFNGDQMAYELNVVGKHMLEKQAALQAHCFTTVSEITARECKQLLGKAPDIVTPNGFEFDFIPKEDFEKKRLIARNTLIQITEKLIGKSIHSDAFLLATSGRYEYKNKGIDVFIESINKVKQANPDRSIIAFILVPTSGEKARKDLLNRLNTNHSIHAPLENPFITHSLIDPFSDVIWQYLHNLNFTNEDSSLVKLVFVPSYLDGKDGIFNLPYYDLLVGFDLTIFPSCYEPWGYTPLESIAFHIPTITTQLSGFGLWAKSEGEKDNYLKLGVEIVERTENNYFEIAEKIKDIILQYSTKYNFDQIQKAKKSAYMLSRKASWLYFIQYYLHAYSIGLKNVQV